jgi:hypothetical protein
MMRRFAFVLLAFLAAGCGSDPEPGDPLTVEDGSEAGPVEPVAKRGNWAMVRVHNRGSKDVEITGLSLIQPRGVGQPTTFRVIPSDVQIAIDTADAPHVGAVPESARRNVVEPDENGAGTRILFRVKRPSAAVAHANGLAIAYRNDGFKQSVSNFDVDFCFGPRPRPSTSC